MNRRFLYVALMKSFKFILSEPIVVPFHIGLLFIPFSMYSFYFLMADIFQGGLVYFNILNNKGAFSSWTFLVLPIATLILIICQCIFIKFMRPIVEKWVRSSLIAECIINPAAGLFSAIIFFLYALLFVPFSATWLGLTAFLVLALIWVYFYVAENAEKPKPLEFIMLFKNVGFGLMFMSIFFFFFPSTRDMRNLADKTGNWHYYWFMVGQYSLIGIVVIYAVVFIAEILERKEWARIRKTGMITKSY